MSRSFRRREPRSPWHAPIVISDVGPAATLTLLGTDVVPADYRDLVTGW